MLPMLRKAFSITSARNHLASLLATTATITLLTALSACRDDGVKLSGNKSNTLGLAETTQQGATASAKTSNQIAQNTLDTTGKTESFNISTKGRSKNLPVRLFLVVDNSYATSRDHAEIQKRLRDLVAYVSGENMDIKTVIFSCFKGTKYGHTSTSCLDSSSLSHKDIELSNLPAITGMPNNAGVSGVNSWQGLFYSTLLLAKNKVFTSSEPPFTPLTPTQSDKRTWNITAQTFPNLSFIGDETKRNLSLLAKDEDFVGYEKAIQQTDILQKYQNFFASGQLNLMVIVTGGESTITAQDYVDFMIINYGNTSTVKFFSFFYTHDESKAASAEIARRSQLYTDISKKLEGSKAFNVTGNAVPYKTFFDGLKTQVVRRVKVKSYTLSSECKNLKSVTVNEEAADLSNFTCSGTEFHVTDGNLSKGDKITVTYVPK